MPAWHKFGRQNSTEVISRSISIDRHETEIYGSQEEVEVEVEDFRTAPCTYTELNEQVSFCAKQ